MKYLALLFIILMACDPVKEEYIQPELIDHYNQFYIEAELRDIYPEKKEMHMSFGDPNNGKSAVAYGRGKDWCKIIVDKKYYDSNIDRCESCIELLIFHEMGHGVLNRPHFNEERDSVVHIYSILGTDTLSHDEMIIGIPLSIMHGSNFPGGFYQKNREEYLDELFN